MAKAKALVKASGTAGQKVAIVVGDDAVNKAIGTYLQSLLNQLGWKAVAQGAGRTTSSSPTSRTPRTTCRSA